MSPALPMTRFLDMAAMALKGFVAFISIQFTSSLFSGGD